MALTFDDGPGNPNTPSVLNELAVAAVKGTFHVTTTFLGDPTVVALLKRIYTEGHLVGIKLSSQIDPTTWLPAAVVAELRAEAAIVHQLIGVYPKFVRIPYQTLPSNVFAAVQEAGFVVTGWAIDSMDYTYTYASDNTSTIGNGVAARYKTPLTAQDTHPIVLFRSNLQINAYTLSNTVKILQTAITTPLVTLDVCLNTEKYRSTNCPPGGCSQTSGSTASLSGATGPVPSSSGAGGGVAPNANAAGAGAANAATASSSATTTGLGEAGAISGTSVSTKASWTLLSLGTVALVLYLFA
ncbi:hypothetical protein HDU86_004146 [Geranomyces michiganensis]|nr:hypothetical protein HDU86_004146 [Geranomyces michiganensis]